MKRLICLKKDQNLSRSCLVQIRNESESKPLKINRQVTTTDSTTTIDSYDSSSYVSYDYDDPSTSIPYTESEIEYNHDSESESESESIDLNIESDDSNNTITDTNITTSESTELDSTELDSTEEQNNKKIVVGLKKKDNRGRFKSITTLSSYREYKSNEQNIQQKNKLNKNEILEKLRDCTSLNTIEEMDILKTLPIMRTWIRYINKTTKLFRSGGLLLKLQYPDYIVLANPFTKVMWSIKLEDNILFIKDKEEAAKTNKIKDKLFRLYMEGRLVLN